MQNQNPIAAVGPIASKAVPSLSADGRVAGTDPMGVLWQELDRMSEQVGSEGWSEIAETALVAVVLSSIGYVLLNARGGYWLLSLLLSRPLWKGFDPLEVILAWEQDPTRTSDEVEEEDESLQSIAEQVRERETREVEAPLCFA